MTIDPEFVEQMVGEAEDLSPWSGVILVDQWETLFSSALDLSDQAERIPNTIGTRFAQASGRALILPLPDSW